MPPRPIFNDFTRDLLSIVSIAISIVGFVLTAISLVYAINQIRRTTTAAEAARDAADSALQESHLLFRRFAISNALRFVAEIRLLLLQESWDHASFRFGDLADQAAQLAKADLEWENLAEDLRRWENTSRRVAKGEIKFPESKWQKFLNRLQRKIDELHGPFDQVQREAPK